jgi:Taurine catabolism dioxygenase TauD, TfdA family
MHAIAALPSCLPACLSEGPAPALLLAAPRADALCCGASCAQGYLSVNYSDNYFFLSQRHASVPRLTDAQLEAIKLFNQLAASDELRMDAVLQPGDIQLLSNHVALHARSAFVDHEVRCCAELGKCMRYLLAVRASFPLVDGTGVLQCGPREERPL